MTADPRARLWLIVSSCLLAAGAGCSGEESLPTAEVEGTVTYNQQPVDGTVTFISSTRGAVFSTPVTSGKFKFEKPVEVDTYTVVVTPAANETPPTGPEDLQQQPSPLPEAYANEALTDLKAEVKADTTNTFEFVLQPGGPPGSESQMMTPP
ncbi:MAG: hypothetical protein KY476_25585 [Planctomycetes bacterium]|nr:hypothetical protein [Planctomycetota bacterium]